MLMGVSYGYALENKTLEEAIGQIETIVKYKIVDEKVVHKQSTP